MTETSHTTKVLRSETNPSHQFSSLLDINRRRHLGVSRTYPVQGYLSLRFPRLGVYG